MTPSGRAVLCGSGNTEGVSDTFNTQTVDLVSLSPDGAEVNLYVVQAGTWTGSDGQLASLQEKLHNYVAFALDGQMERAYPETAGLPWRIVIDCQTGAPDARTAELLEQIGPAVQRYGGDVVAQSG